MPGETVREVHDRTGPRGVEERHTADQGRAGARVAAAYGAREDQDIRRAVLRRSHGQHYIGS